MTKAAVPAVIRYSNHPWNPSYLNYNVFDLDDLDRGALISEQEVDASRMPDMDPATCTGAIQYAACTADATARGLL